MIETNVGHNPVQPRVKAAVEPERMNVPVDPQKGFLINIAGVLGGAQQVHGEPKHTLVVSADQLLEGVLITVLDRANYGGFIHFCDSPSAHGASRVLQHNPRVYLEPLPLTEDRRSSYE